jgi:hypothetical protein
MRKVFTQSNDAERNEVIPVGSFDGLPATVAGLASS